MHSQVKESLRLLMFPMNPSFLNKLCIRNSGKPLRFVKKITYWPIFLMNFHPLASSLLSKPSDIATRTVVTTHTRGSISSKTNKPLLFFRHIGEGGCGEVSGWREREPPPEGRVAWSYRQWFADWERLDPLTYLLISSSIYEKVYTCEVRCEGFNGTLTYRRKYILLKLTKTGVLFVTIPVAMYEFTDERSDNSNQTLGSSLRDVLPNLDNQLEVTLVGSTGFVIQANPDSVSVSQSALVGDYKFDTFSNDEVPKCTMLDTKYFQLGCYYTSN